jgi:hypothetical protein
MFAKRSTIRCQFRRTSNGTSGSGASEFTARPLGSVLAVRYSGANASRLSGVGPVPRPSWPTCSGPRSGRSRQRSADAPTPEGATGRRSMRHRPTKVYETLVSVLGSPPQGPIESHSAALDTGRSGGRRKRRRVSRRPPCRSSGRLAGAQVPGELPRIRSHRELCFAWRACARPTSCLLRT